MNNNKDNSIEFDDIDNELEDDSEEFINEEIESRILTPNIQSIYLDIKKGKIILQLDFQRNYVWDIKKKSRLIESILLRIPLPVIYLNEEIDNKKSVIDGQQRLTTIYNFKDDDFCLKSKNKKWNGKKYSELIEEEQTLIDDTILNIIIFTKNNKENLKYEIFQRLNTGSVKLNDMELRNCIYYGRYMNLLKELAKNKKFQEMISIKGLEARMIDALLVHRFCALIHTGFFNYKDPMKTFLNKDAEKYRNINANEIDELEKKFKHALI